MLQTRPWTGVCEPLMPDVMAPKVHQNNRKNTKQSKLGGGRLLGTIRYTHKKSLVAHTGHVRIQEIPPVIQATSKNVAWVIWATSGRYG